MTDRVDFVSVGWYWNPLGAWLVRNRLADEGLHAIVVDEFVPTTNWFYSNAVGGIKVQVPRDEQQCAIDILAQGKSDVFARLDDRPRPHERRATCRHCESRNVGRERYSLRAVFLSLFVLGFPLPFRSNALCCFDCQHREGRPTSFAFQYTIADILIFTLLVAVVLGVSQWWLELAVASYRHELP